MKRKIIARFLLIDKKALSGELVRLSINKNEHPKGFGALEDCPNKTKIPYACGLRFDRLEGDAHNSGKCCNFSLQLLPNRLFCRVILGLNKFWTCAACAIYLMTKARSVRVGGVCRLCGYFT